MEDVEESGSSGGSRVGGCLLQVVTHGVALVLGAGLGIAGMRLQEFYSDPEILSRPEGEFSRAELIEKLDAAQKQYADLLAEQAKKDESHQTEIAAANSKVTDLQGQVSAKQDEVKMLELKAKKSAGKSAALKKELEEKQAELESLQAQLQTALAEKAQLEQDLTVSREETRVSRQETEVSRSETVDAKWDLFKSDAVVAICEKGNRNKLAKCKDEVRTAMTDSRASTFKKCVASHQAQPRLVRVDEKVKDPQLPAWSEWVGQDSNFTKNKWYITFCDPTLPESTSVGAGSATGAAAPDDL
jgi:hypothetical protein